MAQRNPTHTDWFHDARWGVFTHYLGEMWGVGAPRFTDGFVRGYTEYVNSKGGVVTWDVPIGKTGVIPQDYIEQLKQLAARRSESA